MEKKNQETVIYATLTMKRQLKEKFRCSSSAVSLALSGKRHSPLAIKIRTYAVNRLNAIPIPQ